MQNFQIFPHAEILYLQKHFSTHGHFAFALIASLDSKSCLLCRTSKVARK